MQIIFDFDDTLFHADTLKEKIKEFFITYSVPADMVEKTYKDIFPYSLDRHIAYLNEKFGFLHNASSQDFFTQNKPGDFLEPDTIAILSALQTKHTLILLSRGDVEFQHQKIKFSTIEKFFSGKIFITETQKDVFLKLHPITEKSIKTFFINDKFVEIEAIKKIHPEWEYILFRWPYENSTPLEVLTVTSLQEVQELIKKGDA